MFSAWLPLQGGLGCVPIGDDALAPRVVNLHSDARGTNLVLGTSFFPPSPFFPFSLVRSNPWIVGC